MCAARGPAGRWSSSAQHVRDLLADRDPDYDGLRRAARAGLGIPVSAALGLVFGHGQGTLFAIFGASAMLIMVDFPGNRARRALSYAGLVSVGAALIVLGTAVAPHPFAAVATTFAVGAVVTFSGVLSSSAAAAKRAILVPFVFPVCTPPGPVADRLGGWFIAAAVCVPAALWVLAPRHHGKLRRHCADVAAALADQLSGTGSARAVNTAMNGLFAHYVDSAFRPVGLTAGSRALVRVVDDLGWLCDRIDDGTGAELGPDAATAVRVLRDSAQLLRRVHPADEDRDRDRAELTAAIEELRAVAYAGYHADIEALLRAADDDEAVRVGRQLLYRRTITAQVAVVGRLIAGAAAADARPLLSRILGRGIPPTRASDRVLSEAQAVAHIPSGHLAARSVAVRNSLRTGVGLALAVTVTQLFPVEHGFWVALAVLSVLRNTALSTGTNVVRAMVGTTVGLVIGTALIALIGVDTTVLWLLLPIASFLAAFVPRLWSFTAGQVAFTMQMLIVFNLIQPSGWHVGLLRIESILAGGLVAATVSLLLWPRGSGNALHRAIAAERSASLDYLDAAVARITHSGGDDVPSLAVLGGRALAAARIVDDCGRQFLSESGGTPDRPAPIVREINQVAKLRASADLIADIVEPPSPGAYPRTRAILDEEATTVCARMRDGSTAGVAGTANTLVDALVPALRAEAHAVADPVADALPLITVAANLGELTEVCSVS